MKALLLKRFDRQQINDEVEDELDFHLELLTENLLLQNMSLEEARAGALERFGNVERIKDQCVEISRRNNPILRALKSFLVLVFLAGILVRVLSTEFHVTRLGNILIAVGILSRLLLYVRSLHPSSFLPKHETLSPLILNAKAQISFVGYKQRERTPVERIISDQ